jgi:hypothetical protein
MKFVAWILVADIGLALTIWAERSERAANRLTPISSGMIVAGRSRLQNFDGPIPFPSIKARFVRLPASGIAAMLVMSSSRNTDQVRNLQFPITEKLFEVAFSDVGIDQSTLAWGKLPRVGTDEVLAGADLSRQDHIQVDEESYTVTGGLPRSAGLFARAYVLPADERAGDHDTERDAAFQPALLIPLETRQLANRQVHKQLADRFPAKQFDRMECVPIVGRRAFYLTLLGEGLFLLGGSGVLISLWAAAARVRSGILREPLAVLTAHRRLNWSLHLAYFGLYLAAAAIIFHAPDLRTALQTIIQSHVREGRGLLGVGIASFQDNIAWTALVTFTVNLLLGALIFLTLPSCVIPGAGVLVAGVRAVAWGLLLAPVTLPKALKMLPHTGTLLLEGEGYILAAFFGLMVLLSLVRRPAEPDSKISSGYGRAVLLNLKACVLVALVLAVAATYEAIEVIQMLKPLGVV